MMICTRTDGTRVAIETSLISAIDEIDAGKAPVTLFCGSHPHQIHMTLDALLDAIDEYENTEEPEPDGGNEKQNLTATDETLEAKAA